MSKWDQGWGSIWKRQKRVSACFLWTVQVMEASDNNASCWCACNECMSRWVWVMPKKKPFYKLFFKRPRAVPGYWSLSAWPLKVLYTGSTCSRETSDKLPWEVTGFVFCDSWNLNLDKEEDSWRQSQCVNSVPFPKTPRVKVILT